MIFIFDVNYFRAKFPAYADTVLFPTILLQSYWDSATCYISDENYGILRDDCRFYAINLMTAHLTALGVIIADGQVPGLMQSATIDKVNLSLTPPLLKNEWQWWMTLTPYGQQLYALLQVKSVGGFTIGGSPLAAAFNGAGYGC